MLITYQLHLGDVLLPPKGLLQLWLEGGQEVVRVHDHVHPGVDQPQEGGVAAGEEFARNERSKDHSRVVVYMQEGDLVRLFPKNEKHRVQKIDNFQDEIHVSDVDQFHLGLRVLIVQWLAPQRKVILTVGVLVTL